MKNGNQKPTKQELINAGFEIGSWNFFIKLNEKLQLEIEPISCNSFLDDSEGRLLFGYGNRTKEEINLIYKSFTGKDLDFTPKEKSYAWENCFGDAGFEIEKYSEIGFLDGVDGVKESKNVFKTEAQAKQALALAQLSWIIPAINEDYPADEDSGVVYVITGASNDNDLISLGYTKRGFLPYTIQMEAKEGAEVLIGQHSELLKAALCLTK